MRSGDGRVGIADLHLEEGAILARLVGHRSAVHGHRLERDRMHPSGAIRELAPHRDEPEDAATLTLAEVIRDGFGDRQVAFGRDHRRYLVGADALGICESSRGQPEHRRAREGEACDASRQDGVHGKGHDA